MLKGRYLTSFKGTLFRTLSCSNRFGNLLGFVSGRCCPQLTEWGRVMTKTLNFMTIVVIGRPRHRKHNKNLNKQHKHEKQQFQNNTYNRTSQRRI